MKSLFIALMLVGTSSVAASSQSPYAEEKSHEIKTLSSNEINGLLQGNGMGFAKAAELNKYPGPRHVLDLAEQLTLSKQQVGQTSRIFEIMREQAIDLGAQLVEYERELDTLFASGKVSATALDALLLKIGETRAKLRGAHLHAHLAMKQVLSHHQVMMYDHLRGYADGGEQHGHSH